MSATAWIVCLWLVFTATHLGLASVRVEPGLRKRLGASGFLALYSLVSFATFVPLCWIYFGNRHAGTWLWHVPVGPGLRIALYAGMTLATALIVYGALRPSPASIITGSPTEIRGAYRITRSPVVLGFGLLMGLHLIPNGSSADVAFFGGFLVFALAGAWHQDVRKLHYETRGFAAFHAATGFLPFARGGVRGLAELGILVWVATAVVFFVARWLHPLPIWP